MYVRLSSPAGVPSPLHECLVMHVHCVCMYSVVIVHMGRGGAVHFVKPTCALIVALGFFPDHGRERERERVRACVCVCVCVCVRESKAILNFHTLENH